jgi:predicted deacylase
VRRPALAALGALVLALSPLLPAPTAAAAATDGRGAVVESRVIGRSVQGRAIRAWHLGEPGRTDVPRVLLMSTMHGDEGASRQILAALRDGRPIRGIDLWVVPVVNPDGLARGTRRNAHGVDLNRNFPHTWVDLDGDHESGSGPASEPETQAMMSFVQEVRPDRVLSFHQPLFGVDTDTKAPGLAREVARRLHLPRTTLSCGGVCHGTMTGWFNETFPGAMLTVEHGAHPARRTMRVDAPRQVLAVFGARRGGGGGR